MRSLHRQGIQLRKEEAIEKLLEHSGELFPEGYCVSSALLLTLPVTRENLANLVWPYTTTWISSLARIRK
jgi:hypothetical protein